MDLSLGVRPLDPSLSVEELARETHTNEGGKILLGIVDAGRASGEYDPGDDDPERDPLADTHVDDDPPTECVRRNLAEASTQVVRRPVVPAAFRSDDPAITKARTEAIERKRIEQKDTDVESSAPEKDRRQDEAADTELDMPVRSFCLRYPSRMVLGQVHEVSLVAGPASEAKRYRVVPRIPGCVVSPLETQLTLGSAATEAKFWVTPLVTGRLPDGEVDLVAGERRLGRASFRAEVASGLAWRVWLAIGLVLPWLGAAMALIEIRMADLVLPLVLSGVLAACRPIGGVEVVSVVGAVLAVAQAFRLRARSRPVAAQDVFAIKF